MVKSIALILVFLGVIPFLLGLFYTRFVEEEKDNILLHMAAGYVIMFGLFEIVALPLIWMRQSLSMLIVLYGGILLVAAGISLVINVKRLHGILFGTARAVLDFTACIWAQLFVILGQVLFYIRYQYLNADDAFYVAAASTSIATNTIFAYNPHTGTAYESLPSRYVLSPFYAFTAVVSKVTDTHPAIMSHSVFMILFLLFSYAVYALLGRILFSKNMEKLGYFLILLSALNLFAAYSERTSGLFLFIRLWQGKAILAGILLPMILYLAIRMFWMPVEQDDSGEFPSGMAKGKRADWLLLLLLMAACCMVSSMGIILGAIMLGIIGIVSAFWQRSIRLLICTAFCCLPNLFCAGIYLVIK